MPNSGRAGSWHIYIPKLQRNHHTDFQSHFINFHCQQLWMGIILVPYFHQNGLSFVFLILSILTGIRWNIKVILFAFLCGQRLLDITIRVPPPFVLSLLRIFCLDLYPFLLGYFLFFPHSFFSFFLKFTFSPQFPSFLFCHRHLHSNLIYSSEEVSKASLGESTMSGIPSWVRNKTLLHVSRRRLPIIGNGFQRNLFPWCSIFWVLYILEILPSIRCVLGKNLSNFIVCLYKWCCSSPCRSFSVSWGPSS